MKEERIRNRDLCSRIMSPQRAASMIKDGMTIGISGFTSSGYPKEVLKAVAENIRRGEKIKIDLYSGASVGDEVDGELARVNAVRRRFPYQTNKYMRSVINTGEAYYSDVHLSLSTQYVNYGVMGDVDIAIVEAVAITEEGDIVPTTSIGNTAAFVKNAEMVIVEVNSSMPVELEGMADIFDLKEPPEREVIPITHPAQRIGVPYIRCGIDKIVGIVFTDQKDNTRPFSEPDEVSRKISDNILSFFENETQNGRLGKSLLPLQSGVGSVANAVLYGLCDSQYEGLRCYTEVIQDSMLDLIKCGKVTAASTTAVSPSPERLEEFLSDLEIYRDKIVLRPQEISNSPEVIRRLGVIAMNTALEVDIYGNVNSTHVMGSKMMNGIGGSGDFSRNAAISIFSTPSTAKNGNISAVVPMVSHVDHTEHEVMVVVTEYGYADLRGLSPRERALEIINKCAHPDYRGALMKYFSNACKGEWRHTPHMLDECFSWHERFMKTGSMR